MSHPTPPDPAAERALSRRAFLVSAAGTAGALAAGSAACAPGAVAAASPEPVYAPAPAAPFELDEMTIAQMQEAMHSGRYTARRLAELYLERIEALDSRGPTLRSVIETNPDALALADELDAERRAGRVRGPLHGIPILIKDNIDTADRMMTTAGSLALVGARPARDAVLVAELRAAGALLLGKTNLSEWANFRSTRSSSGWSGRGGQCRNPYALDRSPCGSSSGSGTAIAANLAAAAVGTETDGSIVCPSSAAALVGIKPTLGLVSGAGVVPIAHSQDTPGPMARTVADATALLDVLAMSGAPADITTLAAAPRPQGGYTGALDPNGLRGARIGVAREKFFGYSPEADRLAEAAIEVMRAQGATIVDPADIPHAGEYDDSEFTVLLYEFKHDLDAYLASLTESPVRSMKDVIAFNERERAREMPYFGQEIMLMAQEKGPLTEKAYRDALARNHRLSRAAGIDAVMNKHRLDALVMPTGHPVWPIDLVNGDHYMGSSSTPAAVAGYPHITVPAGYAFGLPVGISFVGRAWSEPVLIRLAYAYEQATKHRTPPRFLPTAETSFGN